MSDRTGLGPLETAVLLGLHDCGATPDRLYLKSAKSVGFIADRFGYGPRYAYDALCDLARPWLVAVPLVAFHGNYGSPDFPQSDADVTEARLAPAGALAVAAEREQVGPVPLGIINGTTYAGGRHPPFSPRRVIAALLALSDDSNLPANQVADIVGPPSFPGGCEVGGAVDDVMDGLSATLIVRSRVEVATDSRPGTIVITDLPPMVGPSLLTHYLKARAEGRDFVLPWERGSGGGRPRLPLAAVEDRTHGESWGAAVRIECRLEPGVDVDAGLDLLRDVPGVAIELLCQLPGPIGELIRTWHAARPARGHAVPLLRDVLGSDHPPGS